MNTYAILNYFHRQLGKSRFASRLAIYIRNQCRCIIHYHLTGGSALTDSGEFFLIQALGKRIKTFIDVGANIGDWTDLMAKYAPDFEQAVLFEPSEIAFRQIKDRFGDNSKIELIQAAVADEPGELSFFEEPNSGHTSSLVPGFSAALAIEKKVSVTTLDSEVEKRSLGIINLLKVDTEGYDLHVLRGTKSLLAKQQIEIIQFEYNQAWALAGSTLHKAYELVESFGYHVFLLKADGLFKLNYQLYGEYFDYSNFVAISSKKLPELQHLIVGSI
jgi:FkbM family methyltransferase